MKHAEPGYSRLTPMGLLELLILLIMVGGLPALIIFLVNRNRP